LDDDGYTYNNNDKIAIEYLIIKPIKLKTMQNENHGNQVEILNDLVRINNDRIEGYKKAMENLKEPNPQLQTLFTQLQQQSAQYTQELREHIQQLGGSADNDTTTAGKIYRTWMDVKAAFGGDDAQGVLNSCDGGEEAANKAYQTALNNKELRPECLSLLNRQHIEQQEAHQRIKNLRDHLKNTKS
jgi:uncharacterized protein (TIGR02284 family)